MENLSAISSPVSVFVDRPIRTTAPAKLITEEVGWRVLPKMREGVDTPTVAHWNGLSSGVVECRSETPGDCHIAGIALRNIDVRFSLDGRSVHDGALTAGSLHVTPPDREARCRFMGPYDVLHLFMPKSLIEECSEDLIRRSSVDWIASLVHDPTILHLARSLMLSGQESCRELHDHITMAMVTRLVLSTQRSAASATHNAGGLPRWRLKRVIDYIDANLDQTLSLADVSAASGLSRMHFAAQFRKSTGQRPHQYVLNRRVERAQEMLAGTDLPIVQIALAVGFQAQSHFTTIFKRVVGQPPHAWRRDRDASGARLG